MTLMSGYCWPPKIHLVVFLPLQFFERVEEDWHLFFFKCLVEFTSDTMWTCVFLVGRLLITNSISVLVIGLLSFSVSL